jgi:hypothetical protein
MDDKDRLGTQLRGRGKKVNDDNLLNQEEIIVHLC